MYHSYLDKLSLCEVTKMNTSKSSPKVASPRYNIVNISTKFLKAKRTKITDYVMK